MSKTKGRAGLFASIADGLTGALLDDVVQLPLSKLLPNARQPRRYFDPEALTALAASVNERGVLQPLLVRPLGDSYEIVAGERRYRAAQLAGRDPVPVIVKQLTDEEAVELALVENLQREDLNPVEETEALVSLYALRRNIPRAEVAQSLQRLYFSVTKGEVDEDVKAVEQFFSELAGMSWKSFVNHRLPLLKLPEDVLEVLRAGKIEYTKAREIAKVKDPGQRKKLLTKSSDEGLSLKEVKERIREVTDKPVGSHSRLLTRMVGLRSLAQRSKALEQPATRERVEALLVELESLLGTKLSEPPEELNVSE